MMPSEMEYVDALLDDYPRAVLDPEVRSGRLRMARGGPFETPWRSSGARSMVLCVLLPDGTRRALKLFTTEGTSKELPRYRAVERVLRRLPLRDWRPRSFRLVERAVRLGSSTYPALWGEFVEGVSLRKWVSRAVKAPQGAQALSRLAYRILTIVSDLEVAGVSHADLWSNNILVDSAGAVRLIDWDDLWAKETQGFGAASLGQEDFQHPDRIENGGHWGPNGDRFSALSIYAALLALTLDPALLSPTGPRLIWGREDYRDPLASPGLLALERTGRESLRVLARALRRTWSLPPERLPALEPVRGRWGALWDEPHLETWARGLEIACGRPVWIPSVPSKRRRWPWSLRKKPPAPRVA